MGTESGAATTIVTERMAGRGAFLTPYSRRAYARAGGRYAASRYTAGVRPAGRVIV